MCAQERIRHLGIHRFVILGQEVHSPNSLQDEMAMISPPPIIQDGNRGNVLTSTVTIFDFGVSPSPMIESNLGLSPS